MGAQYAEGAWRDLRATTRAAGSGFITSISSDGPQLMLRFFETDASDLVVVTLKPAAGGGWSGQLWRAGTITPVTLKRG